MNISRKLILGFVSVALLAGLTGGFGLWRMSQMDAQAGQIEDRYMPGVIALGDVRSQLGDYRIFEVGLIQNHDNPDMVADFSTRLPAAREEVLARMREYEALMGGLDDRELANATHAAIDHYFEAGNRIIGHVAAAEAEAAQSVSDADSRPRRRAMAQSVEALIDSNRARLTTRVAESNADYRSAAWTLVVASLAAVAAGIGLALLISRAIAAPLRDAVAVAESIARGDLSRTIHVRSNDETGRLATAMQRMVVALRSFDSAQREMAAAHDAGEIDSRMDSDLFQGTFAELATQTNQMVASHLAVQQRMAEVVDAYARGDFREDMDRLPGQKARITEAMDQVKINLGAIKDDILRLSEAASRGDFSARGNVSAYQFAFADMVRALNTLMEQADSGLSDVGEVLQALAAGDLTRTVDGRHEGAFGELAASTNQTVVQLRSIVARIHQATEAINTAASEIASGNTDLSRRTESQAASLEETASSMEELTSTVQQNAEHSRRARELATGAAEVASSGGGVVEKVVITMGEISESSRRIEEIIGVIDGIAFQTNILALNAAVEAARAGEQGRGFAVVASEVRSLAQRSADAAKQIKGLIEASGSRVEAGAELVNQAGATMRRLVESVGEVNHIIAEIAAASDEQASGIQQVSTTVMQMDEVTQQNAALVEEATASARSLEDQAVGLAHAVSAFRISGDRPRGKVASPARGEPVAA